MDHRLRLVYNLTDIAGSPLQQLQQSKDQSPFPLAASSSFSKNSEEIPSRKGKLKTLCCGVALGSSSSWLYLIRSREMQLYF